MLRRALLREGHTIDGVAVAATVVAAWIAASPCQASRPVRLPVPHEETVEVVRRVVAVRLDPKRSAAPGACDALAAGDLDVRVGASRGRVTDLERLPRPRVVWLLLDTSHSVESVRNTVKRDAARVVREFAQLEGKEAALVTVDEDTRLVVAPTDDYDRLAVAIDGVPPGGQSFLRDGLAEVLGQIAGDRREHVVIFWTDGADGMSVGPRAELEDALARAPNARVVPVVLPALGDGTGSRLLDGLFFGLARRSGGDVYQAGGDWIDRLRGSLSRRWVVTVAPPAGEAPGAPVSVEAPRLRCEVKILDVSGGAGALPATPPSWEEAWRRQRRRDDVEPCLSRAEGDKPWRLAPRGEAGRIDGCALDVVRERGILYRDRAWGRSEIFSRLEMASRPWSVTVPGVGGLARSPEEALDRLAAELPDERRGPDDSVPRSPRLIHGRTLLALQGTIARAMWETQPSMRALAKRALATEAERGLAVLAAALRVTTPTLNREQAEAAARASLEGRRLLGAVEEPGDGDLRRTLAAWLGDVGAREIFERWERILAERRLAGLLGVDEAERRWRALRPRFALPDRVRLLALLVPGRQGADGPVGFWRVVLPRAVWILGRLTDDVPDVPYDHVPERPLGLLALDRALAGDPDLAREGSRVVAVSYEPLVKTWREDPAHPFGRGIVRVTLARGEGTAEKATVIEAAFEAARGGLPEIVRVDVR